MTAKPSFSASAAAVEHTKRARKPGRTMFDNIEMFYNPARKHVRNGMPSPVRLERQQILKLECL